MKGDPIRTTVLSVQYIPNADSLILRQLKVQKGHNSLGLITTDCDDVSYSALDEATKKADVQVAYARSMYAGSKNATTKLAGEFIGILSGPDPEEVRSGIEATVSYIEHDACFYSANEENSIAYYAQCISRSGSYLSEQAKIPSGEPLAYLIAPPVEAMVGIDAALKAANVTLKVFYGPPTETNHAGALSTGEQSACQAACDAFADKVCRVAREPMEQ